MGRGIFGGCSNTMAVILNSTILIASLQMLRMLSFKDSACEKLLETPFLVSGASLFVVSIFGIVGAGFRISSFLWLYLATSFFIILGLSCFTAYLFMAVREGHGGGGNPLGGYSSSMQRSVNGGSWERIRTCLGEFQVCAKPLESASLESDIYNRFIAPIKMECCEKPKACPLKNQQGDCTRWNDKPEVLCFACDSCKAAMLSIF